MTVRQLGRSYTALTEDTTRVKGRLKAVYRGQAIASVGKKVYGARHRGEWLAQLGEAGLRRRAELLYQQLDALQALRREARRELIAESRKHEAVKQLRTVPYLGPIRAAVLLGKVQTPHRFRTKAGGAAFSEAFELGAPSFPVLVHGKGGVLRPRF